MSPLARGCLGGRLVGVDELICFPCGTCLERVFRQLYDQLPGEKPSLDEVWRLTGGNQSYWQNSIE